MLFLFYVGALAVTGAWIVFVVMGFKTSTGWGVANILIPFAQIPFAIKHWDRARTVFIVFMVSNVVFIAGAFGGGTAEYQEKMHAMGEPMSDIEFMDMYRFGSFREDLAAREHRKEMARSVDASEPEPEVEPVPVVAKREPERFEVRYDYREIDIGELHAFVRERILLESSSGKVHEGTLVRVSPRYVTLKKRLRSGTMEFEVANADIRTAKLWTRVSG